MIISILFIFLSNESYAQTVTTITEEFNASGGVAVDTSGAIYVADFGASLSLQTGTNVYRVTLDGEVAVFATGLSGASGNAFDSQGNLFQSNISGGRISKITPDGTVSTFTTSNIIQGPVGVAVDENDNVYTTNCKTLGEIIKTTPAGVSTIFAINSLMSCPNGLTIDDDGNLYTSNFNNGQVIKITPAGVVSLVANIPGGNNGHIIFGNGRLYVVARGANQIYEVTLSGSVKLLAGTGTAGNRDGDALQSSWFIPNGIGISPSGTELYINDKIVGKGTDLHPAVVRVISGIDTATIVSVDEESNVLPSDYSLSNAYPNPFNPITTIEYELAEAGKVKLIIYNVLGLEIERLVDRTKSAGKYKINWDASRYSSGIYFYKLESGKFREIRKLILLK